MQFLKQYPNARIAIEPTNRYHIYFLQQALKSNCTIYLVDAYRVSRYRDAIGVRAKTDMGDAQLIHRYLIAEENELTPYQPIPEIVSHINDLLRARGKLTKEKASIRQSLSWNETLKNELDNILASLERAIACIDKELEECLQQGGYKDDYKRCKGIPGAGPIVSAALVAMFHRGNFQKADAYIAFLGMDVRVRESGKFRGQRKLTKKGNPEVRRLLFNGARAGARTSYWKDCYLALRARGLSATAAHVAIGRKIARIAFALMRDQSQFAENL
jgi:transposase